MAPVWGKITIATAEMAIISRNTLSLPRASDTHPDKIRPAALPAAPMKMPVVARARGTPLLRAKGTN